MASRKELTRSIDLGPSGPKIGAFFDVDRTLLAGFSAAAFIRDKFSNEGIDIGQAVASVGGAFRFGMNQSSFPTFLEESSGDLIGLSEEDLEEVGERAFRRRRWEISHPSEKDGGLQAPLIGVRRGRNSARVRAGGRSKG